jgi:hypothetical protein
MFAGILPAGVHLEIFISMKAVLVKALMYLRNIVLVDLAIALAVAATFIFTRNFTFTALSERIFWVGLVITLVAGIVAFSAMFSGRSMGIPVTIRKPEEARHFLDHFGEFRAEIDKRHSVSIQLFIIGLGCIVVSALVQSYLGQG